jgi:3-phenylpropionate/cinnamic acid dioxygenase small subunit
VGTVDERMTTVPETTDLYRAVEQFLYREARLMDANDYDGWLQLWAEECTYWVPCNDDDADPRESVAIIYNGRKQLEDRVWRLKGLHAHAQRPKSRLSRIVANIEIERSDAAEVVVHSAFMLCEIRKNETRFWAGKNLHVLLRGGDGLAIKLKKVMLANNDTIVPNLTFLI